MSNNPSKNDKNFTSTEVGALVEELRWEFKAVSEVVVPMREDIAEIKDRLTVVETDVRSIKDVLGIAIPSLTRRVSALEVKVGV